MQIKSLKINILTKKNQTVLKTKSRKKNLPTMTTPFGAFSYKNFELELSQFRKFQDQVFLALMLKFYFCLDVLRICSV